MMRIGIITDPIDTNSSIGIYLSKLIQSLYKICGQHQFHLVHMKRNKHRLYFEANEVIIPGLYHANFPSASLGDVHRPFLLKKHNLDIIHYNHTYAPLTFSAAGAINICTIHTIGPFTHPQYYPYPSRYLIKIAKFVNRRMDAIITVSEAEKGEIVKFMHISEDKVKVVYPGLESDYMPISNVKGIKAELAVKYAIMSPYIVHVGAYRPVKNGPMLIRAFAQLKQQGIKHKLVFVGKPVHKFNEVQSLVSHLGLENDVIFTGFVPEEDLPKLYNAADLFVLPSFNESFPHVLLEALASGCPTVTSNIACMSEIVGDAGVLIDPYSAESLAEGIYRVLTDKELRRDMREKGLMRAKLFSWEKCARETLMVYEELYESKAKESD